MLDQLEIFEMKSGFRFEESSLNSYLKKLNFDSVCSQTSEQRERERERERDERERERERVREKERKRE